MLSGVLETVRYAKCSLCEGSYTVLLFLDLNEVFVGYFASENIFLENENKYFSTKLKHSLHSQLYLYKVLQRWCFSRYVGQFIPKLPILIGTKNIIGFRYPRNVLFDFSGVKPFDKSSISVYPNPASQGFQISLSPELAKGKLSILSMDGKMVLQKILSGQSEIEINDYLNSGTYIIKVESENKVGVEKLIIK